MGPPPAIAYRVAQWLSVGLPPRAAFGLAGRLADLHCATAPKDAAIVHANLQILLGRALPLRAPQVGEVFRNFGRYLAEFLAIHRVGDPEVTVTGRPCLQQAAEARRGVILLGAHVGNWEVGAVLVRRMGLPIAVVALPHQQAGVNAVFTAQRRRCGVEVIALGRAAMRQSLSWLRQGALVGMLGDRNFSDRGIAVTFCNGMRLLPRGPAVLSLRSGAPVVPTFLIREGLWKFRCCFEPPIWPGAHGRTDRAVASLTQAYAAALERVVQRLPEQWLMFQPIHSTSEPRPTGFSPWHRAGILFPPRTQVRGFRGAG